MTEEELRPYSALPAVLNGMFNLLSRLFDVDVRRANDSKAEVCREPKKRRERAAKPRKSDAGNGVETPGTTQQQ